MFATTLHALRVTATAGIAGIMLAPGAAAHAAPAAVLEFNTGVSWSGGATVSATPGSSVLLTAVYDVAGEPPADAVLGFTVRYPVGVTLESPGQTCTVDAVSRTASCSSPAEGTTVQLRATVGASVAPGAALALTAAVNPAPGDAEPADDEATTTITVVPLQVGVRVTGPVSAPQGEPFAMRVVLTNDSDTDLPAGFRGQVSMNLPAGGENLFTWVTVPPGCVPDPLSFVCDDPVPLPAGESRTVVFRFEALPGSVGRVFTLLARYEPTEGTSVSDSAEVRITAPVVDPPPADPGDGGDPDPAPAAGADQGAGARAPAAELPATGSATVPLTALGLSLLLLGVLLTRSRRSVG